MPRGGNNGENPRRVSEPGPQCAERYCGQLQSYQYQGLVQYAQVNACRSALAARSIASSGTSTLTISSSPSAWLITSLSIASAPDAATSAALLRKVNEQHPSQQTGTAKSASHLLQTSQSG